MHFERQNTFQNAKKVKKIPPPPKKNLIKNIGVPTLTRYPKHTYFFYLAQEGRVNTILMVFYVPDCQQPEMADRVFISTEKVIWGTVMLTRVVNLRTTTKLC